MSKTCKIKTFICFSAWGISAVQNDCQNYIRSKINKLGGSKNI